MMDIKTERPYFYTFNQYLKDSFPDKIYKIPIDAGFTCPNRDGSRGYGGCTYCDNISFSPGARLGGIPIEEQIAKGIEYYRLKRKAKKFIVYFQAYSNTYAPVSHLKDLYDRALTFPEVIGISIGTRPDCIDREKIELIRSYKDRDYYVLVEYGLESMKDSTLESINRKNTFQEFMDAVHLTHEYGLDVCVHTILGLPGDTREDILDMAKLLAQLKVKACKIHHLYIAPNTVMEKQWREGNILLMEAEEYIHLVCDFLELLPPDMVIHRFIGELYGEHCLAPRWGLMKAQVLDKICLEFEHRKTCQGSRYQP